MRTNNQKSGKGASLPFPQPLAEKYRPKTIGDFIGLAKPKAVMEQFQARPYPSAWLYLGESGVGKTSMALALAESLPAELYHIPSRSCDMDTVAQISRRCSFVPMHGKFHLILVDEADQMTQAAQHAFLSKMDATEWPPNTIFIFTANSTNLLEDRFLSRCRILEFPDHGIAQELPKYLRRISRKETGKPNGIDFRSIAEQCKANVREALSRLEIQFLAGGIEDEPPSPARRQQIPAEDRTIYQERAAKAVATRERNLREKFEQEKNS